MCSQASDMGMGSHGDVWVACLGGMFGWLGQAICQIFSEAEAKIARLHPARCRNRVLSVSLSPGQICGRRSRGGLDNCARRRHHEPR